jgi:DnaJ-class molecular chaperone
MTEETCSNCRGDGVVKQVEGGVVVTVMCGDCSGRGKIRKK